MLKKRAKEKVAQDRSDHTKSDNDKETEDGDEEVKDQQPKLKTDKILLNYSKDLNEIKFFDGGEPTPEASKPAKAKKQEKSGSVKVQDVSEPNSRESGRSLNPGHTHNIAGQKESDKEHLIE